MALTADERERLAAALAETPGALEAIALLELGAAKLPAYEGTTDVADVLLRKVRERAGVPSATADELLAIARPLVAGLRVMRALAEVRRVVEAAGATLAPEVLADARARLAWSVLAHLGLPVPPLAGEGGVVA